ncbi:hypothetical protein BpHYR1_022992 [Brachionus plicatilis]|uniref:Uncharacterized protein n=1 Tax=Brachionus plicatilis TaxID=10195 RepID=A0A3M7QVW1_BRAPC|nr:hypothetical protein BpHYR1_022992 [Brachionus plicatilis]
MRTAMLLNYQEWQKIHVARLGLGIFFLKKESYLYFWLSIKSTLILTIVCLLICSLETWKPSGFGDIPNPQTKCSDI